MKLTLIVVILLALIFVAIASDDCPFQLYTEYPPAGEDDDIQTIVNTSLDILKSTYPPGNFIFRDAHPKAHGCVKATFTVDPKIKSRYRIGIFRNPGQQYNAVIRFSNGNPKVQKDILPDSRGFALKLFNVPGKKLLEDEKDALTHDFVGANAPHFFLKNNEDYIGFFDAIRQGPSKLLKFFIHNGMWTELNAARKFLVTIIRNPLSTQYWSATPYRLGEMAIKFTFKPVACPGGSLPNDNVPNPFDANYLRTRMSSFLESHDACFDFMIQEQVDACEQQIEDSRIEWSTDLSGFEKIASIRIPKQSFLSKETQTKCENLSFTPWHALKEHQPLGNINRARKAVYNSISKFRHAKNGVPRVEPTGW